MASCEPFYPFLLDSKPDNSDIRVQSLSCLQALQVNLTYIQVAVCLSRIEKKKKKKDESKGDRYRKEDSLIARDEVRDYFFIT